MKAIEVPTAWRSVLPYVGSHIPPSRTPPAEVSRAATAPTKVNLPLELFRQSVQTKEFWPIPAEILEAYLRYRPTPLWRAHGFERAIGARTPVYVKYEGGNISGSHKLNTAIAQAYYYAKAGARELVTGTGAGQWGTALAAACAMFGLRCTVFMVGSSLAKKPYRRTLMRTLGATVHASPSGLTEVSRLASAGQVNSLSLAIGEAVEYAHSGEDVAFSIGSGENYTILHQSVIGIEAAAQLTSLDAPVGAVVGCVGAGSNFGGIALPFFALSMSEGQPPPLLLAAESAASPKLTEGVYAYDHTDATGSGPLEAMYTIGSSYAIPDSHSAGLRYHGTAKLLSAMRGLGQIEATAIGQVEALEAGRVFTRAEMVLPAPESGHALAAAARLAAGGLGDAGGMPSGPGIVVVVSGNGYLDLAAYQQLLDGGLSDEAPNADELRRAMQDLTPIMTPAQEAVRD